MYAVATTNGKILAIVSSQKKAQLLAVRKGQRKGRTYIVIPWNG